ncbi:c-di-GMP phosphodiesterase [Leptospira langatensis]|uniref:C-di-GMP phosphodiesterase n=1 Tax=Leptospira langatensis TaxID=2484983 RepID=A0A5F1ZU27_9LEPT|nr:HD domain-containing phosphohydrolase [Leptospira langatensis]TGK01587.1 c-di-GMP phosphodiesterase [Leptospira langatensis]TGL41963.1 c-di-GMP phosphodiesterase [Leptospira langatensis]
MASNSGPQDPLKLERFEFNADVIRQFKENQVIPIDFYNKNGQILIHRKDNATEADINKLQKFELQGIYFLLSERHKVTVNAEHPDAVNGRKVSFIKLVNPDLTIQMAKQASELLKDLRDYPLNGNHVKNVAKAIDSILDDFSNSQDVELGLVNVIEVMKSAGVETDSEILTKRTVISMAMKLRSLKALSLKDAENSKAQQLNLMMAAYMVDIGKSRMKFPAHGNLSKEEFEYVKNHPVISYLMIGNLPSIQTQVKTSVLNSHRPYRGEGLNNNYPSSAFLVQRLNEYYEKYKDDPTRSVLVEDLQRQLYILQSNSYSEDDPAIISISGEFASLSSTQNWRPAYAPITAMKLILNNSFFSYNERVVKEFFDFMALSLCENKSVLNVGDYVIVVSTDSQHKIHFETCIIREINRNQTRPLLERVGTIRPIFSNSGKIKIAGYDRKTFRPDRRKAVFNLANTVDPRRVIYAIDPELDPPLFDLIDKNHRQTAPKSVA